MTKYVDGSIANWGRLDPFDATAVLCIRNDGTDKVRGHYRKRHQDTFANYLSKAYSQLLSYIAAYVLTWNLDASDVFTLKARAYRNEIVLELKRKATVNVYDPSMNR